ncbi:hypothetical protein PILCRDRAFT_816962 [Piloderma croceum F 1598]|uniref:Uncharacterized protein n=1 Tax=Piloderma croceum (strain F 1598) TaxID=765440 RepID=A0A0C3G544_PILCF|nr:hypothetical protein PILCRDRAFT_816962 [Piloderma croceum F 1598]
MMQLTPTRLAILGYHWWGSAGTHRVEWYQLEGGVDFGGVPVVRAILDTSLDNSVACGLVNSGGPMPMPAPFLLPQSWPSVSAYQPLKTLDILAFIIYFIMVISVVVACDILAVVSTS